MLISVNLKQMEDGESQHIRFEHERMPFGMNLSFPVNFLNESNYFAFNFGSTDTTTSEPWWLSRNYYTYTLTVSWNTLLTSQNQQERLLPHAARYGQTFFQNWRECDECNDIIIILFCFIKFAFCYQTSPIFMRSACILNNTMTEQNHRILSALNKIMLWQIVLLAVVDKF